MKSVIEQKLGALSTGFDVAFAAVIVIHVLGKPVPWYLWLWVAAEVFVCLSIGISIAAQRRLLARLNKAV